MGGVAWAWRFRAKPGRLRLGLPTGRTGLAAFPPMRILHCKGHPSIVPSELHEAMDGLSARQGRIQ
jgi:hypothetical protein